MKRNTIILGIMILFLLAGCGGMGVMVGERAAPTPTQAVPAKAVTACTDLNKVFQLREYDPYVGRHRSCGNPAYPRYCRSHAGALSWSKAR